jgi:hypothetical protein
MRGDVPVREEGDRLMRGGHYSSPTFPTPVSTPSTASTRIPFPME